MNIYSIFPSINGEICQAYQGSMCTFVRLAGCSLGCSYCDTKYASDPKSGYKMNNYDILKECIKLGNPNVTITGGEPMEQKEELTLLVQQLLFCGYNVSIETNGEIPFNRKEFGYDKKLSFVVDIKLDKSGETINYLKMLLTDNDFLKFVIGNYTDMKHASSIKRNLQEQGCKATFAFSAKADILSSDDLLRWMKEFHQHDSILNVQLHKLLCLNEHK